VLLFLFLFVVILAKKKKKKKKKKKIIIIIIIESNQLDSEVYRRFISMGIIYNIFIYKK